MMPEKNKPYIYNISELVTNPTNITRHLVAITLKLYRKNAGLFKQKTIFEKFNRNFKINIYLRHGYYEFYSLLTNYKLPDFNEMEFMKINLLFNEFEKLYEKLIYNNFALTYLYVSGKKLINPVFTMEDKKNLFLQKLFNNEITIEQFNREFGHYALNAFELSSRRFEEYAPSELVNIAKFVSGLHIKHKPSFDEYIKLPKKDILPVIIALRELGKYKTLLIIRALRYELLHIAKKYNINAIFNLRFDEIINLIKCG